MENSNSSEKKNQENLWVCGASRTSIVTDGSEWCKDVMDEAYVPIPFSEEKLEPLQWKHVLATLDVCTLNHGIKFCDEEGYDIVPICMVRVMDELLELNVPQIKP